LLRDPALLLFNPVSLRLRALALGVGARALALALGAGALFVEPTALVVAAPLLLHHAALLLRLLPARLVLTLLAGLQIAPESIVLPAPCVPVALVLVRAPLRLAPLLVVVAADLDQVGALAPLLDPVPLQPGVVGTGDPGLVAVAHVAADGHGAAQVVADVRRDVVARDIGREQAGRADEAPRRLRHVRVVGVTGRRPADVAVALAPLHPGRTPRRVRAPDPAVGPYQRP
jgi:hypothetical protein